MPVINVSAMIGVAMRATAVARRGVNGLEQLLRRILHRHYAALQLTLSTNSYCLHVRTDNFCDTFFAASCTQEARQNGDNIQSARNRRGELLILAY